MGAKTLKIRIVFGRYFWVKKEDAAPIGTAVQPKAFYISMSNQTPRKLDGWQS